VNYGKAASGIRAGHDASVRLGDDDTRMGTGLTTRFCSLEAAVGKAEACPEGGCPFWEPGGAVLEGRCAFEELDITADVVLAAWLLEIRERLARSESTVATEEARTLFHHLLNGSDE
jgi:hypothetical protein